MNAKHEFCLTSPAVCCIVQFVPLAAAKPLRPFRAVLRQAAMQQQANRSAFDHEMFGQQVADLIRKLHWGSCSPGYAMDTESIASKLRFLLQYWRPRPVDLAHVAICAWNSVGRHFMLRESHDGSFHTLRAFHGGSYLFDYCMLSLRQEGDQAVLDLWTTPHGYTTVERREEPLNGGSLIPTSLRRWDDQMTLSPISLAQLLDGLSQFLPLDLMEMLNEQCKARQLKPGIGRSVVPSDLLIC